MAEPEGAVEMEAGEVRRHCHPDTEGERQAGGEGEARGELGKAGFGGKESAEEQYVLWQMLRTNARQTTARDYLVAQAIMVNPKLRRARQEIDIQGLRLSLNSARFFPSVSLTSAVQYSDRLRDYRPSFAERDFSWYAGVNLELPLFLGGDRRKERTQLKSELSSLEFSRDRAALDVMRAVNIETGNLISSLRESALLSEALGLQNPQVESVGSVWPAASFHRSRIRTCGSNGSA